MGIYNELIITNRHLQQNYYRMGINIETTTEWEFTAKLLQTCKRLHMVRFRGRDITSFRPADVHLGAYFYIYSLGIYYETTPEFTLRRTGSHRLYI